MAQNNFIKHEELDLLIGRYLDGSISESDFERLENELSENPDARSLLRTAANIEEGLADWALVNTELEFAPSVTSESKSGFAWSQVAAIAACIVLIIFALQKFEKSGDDPITSSDPPIETPAQNDLVVESETEGIETNELLNDANVDEIPKQKFVAYVIDKVDAQFEGLPFDDISDLEKGDYTLLQGSVHLRFKNGATMLLTAPAKFAIENENCFRLYDGEVRALFPQVLPDFQLTSPGVKFYDLDSEIGIRADSLEKRSEINVFQGKVKSTLTGNDEVVQALVSGQAAVYRNGIVEFGKADFANFIEPGSIGFKRWKRNHIRLQSEPDLIGYFPFVEGEPGVVQNFVRHTDLCEFEKMPDGRIGAATWVAGRWPGKRALMFETRNDFVDLRVPGQYNELTIATWVKLDRLSNTFNTILNTNGWSQGAVHFQLDRYGRPWIASYNSQVVNMNERLPVGKWVHLAATLSKKTMRGHAYLNGKLISTTEVKDGTIIRPGQCRLGNWFDPAAPHERRALSGRMDELMIWKKSLSAEKIMELYQQGLPKEDLNYVRQIDPSSLP